MSKAVLKKNGFLSDFNPISKVLDDGFVETSDKRVFFLAQIEGVDALFMDQSELERLHFQWRSLIDLRPEEEMQIVFRRSTSFESFFEKKLDSFLRMKGEFARKLFWSQFEDYIESVNDLEVTELEVILCYSIDLSKRTHDEVLENLRARREELANKFHSAGLGFRALAAEEVEPTVLRHSQTTNYVNSSNLLEWPRIQQKGSELSVEDEVYRAVQLKKLPESFSEMGMMQALLMLPVPLQLSLRLRGKDLEPVKRKVEKRRQLLYGLSSRKATGDPSAESRFQETDELLRRLNEQSDSLCEMSLVVGARSKNPDFLRKVLSEIFSSRGRLQQLEWEESPFCIFDSFLESIPGFKGKVFNKHSVLSSNAIHFLPFFKPSSGDREKPTLTFKTQYGSFFSINPTSSAAANYNWLVSGQSGAGKSFLVNSILLQSLSLNPQIFIVDVGGSYNKLTEFLGGRLIQLDTKDGFSIGPFFAPRESSAQDERKRRAQVELIFQEMLRDEGKLPPIEQRALLSDTLAPLFDQDLPERPVSWLRDQLASHRHPAAERLSLLLKPWCYPDFFGSFVDTNHHLELSDNVVTFDLKGIKEFADLSRVIELVITAAIWAALRRGRGFTWVVLDEVAFSLLKTQPQFVHELVSTCRKMYTGTIIVVQGVEAITLNPAGGAILANTNFKAILTQRGDPKSYRDPLGLTGPEIRAIHSLGRKKGEYSDVFLMDDDRRVVLRYAPEPLTYLLSTTDPQEVMAFNESLASKEGSFPERVLQIVEEARS